MRIVKEPEIRKNEILDAAEKIFSAKSYEEATVSDILAAVNIAKGTFYYYFKSKEDVLDALVERRIRIGVENAEGIIASSLPPVQKLLAIIMAQKPQSQAQKDFNTAFHETGNAKMHQKVLAQCVLRLGPCLTRIIEEGINAGIFNTSFPNENAQILLAAALLLFDDDFFHWTDAETAAKTMAFLDVTERSLGAEPGSFLELAKVFI